MTSLHYLDFLENRNPDYWESGDLEYGDRERLSQLSIDDRFEIFEDRMVGVLGHRIEF